MSPPDNQPALDGVAVRFGGPDDRDALVAARRAMVADIKAIGVGDPYAEGLSASAAQLATYVDEILADPRHVVVVARLADRDVGHLLGRIHPSSFPAAGRGDVGYIHMCRVEPDIRGRGVGRRLARAAEDWFREAGAPRVELSWLASNRLAASAWSSLGYAPFRVFGSKLL